MRRSAAFGFTTATTSRISTFKLSRWPHQVGRDVPSFVTQYSSRLLTLRRRKHFPRFLWAKAGSLFGIAVEEFIPRIEVFLRVRVRVGVWGWVDARVPVPAPADHKPHRNLFCFTGWKSNFSLLSVLGEALFLGVVRGLLDCWSVVVLTSVSDIRCGNRLQEPTNVPRTEVIGQRLCRVALADLMISACKLST